MIPYRFQLSYKRRSLLAEMVTNRMSPFIVLYDCYSGSHSDFNNILGRPRRLKDKPKPKSIHFHCCCCCCLKRGVSNNRFPPSPFYGYKIPKILGFCSELLLNYNYIDILSVSEYIRKSIHTKFARFVSLTVLVTNVRLGL